jgi:hypothetical protein
MLLRTFVGVLAMCLLFSVGECSIRYLVSQPNATTDGLGSLQSPYNSLQAAFDPKTGVADGDELRVACGDYPAWWGETPMYAVNITILGGYWDQGELNCTPVMRSAFLFRRMSGIFTNIIIKNLHFESGKALRFAGPDDGPAALDNIQIIKCKFYQRGISAGVVKLRDISVGTQDLFPMLPTSALTSSFRSWWTHLRRRTFRVVVSSY